ncbi:MAG: UDP-3-O-(3-hydroxymyristoyl)glucosamine N-acyltransferase [Oscillospiraceae bacterium]|nr:UDP-3-O-(3-hydroxymyristoyl)glucosamine N-acyltransferase [Oscillospiraceae bacterium]
MVKTKDILEFIRTFEEGAEVVSESGGAVCGVSPLSDAKDGTVTWVRQECFDLAGVNAEIVICPLNFRQTRGEYPKTLVKVRKPRLCFMKVAERFFAPPKPSGKHPNAVIEQGANIGPDTYIGANTFVGGHVSIGRNTVIYHNVTIMNCVAIGDNCIIHSGAVIGQDGFGYEKTDCGGWAKFPHFGGVTIGKNVYIGANTCIDRGTMGDTIIHDCVKIDNLCHIAHNAVIERNAVVIAKSMVAGSAHIEEGAYIAPSVSVRDGLTIGRESFVGMGSVVVRDVDAGAVVAGVPARRLRDNTEN